MTPEQRFAVQLTLQRNRALDELAAVHAQSSLLAESTAGAFAALVRALRQELSTEKLFEVCLEIPSFTEWYSKQPGQPGMEVKLPSAEPEASHPA